MIHLNGKYKKERGLLKPITIADMKQYEKFVSKLPEGSIVEFAKLHVMLKQLSIHIGESVENMKLLVKDRAGLCIAREVAGKEYFLAKSFGDCSRDELSLAIQAAIEIGQDVNFLLN
jgi:hypothetical protein